MTTVYEMSSDVDRYGALFLEDDAHAALISANLLSNDLSRVWPSPYVVAGTESDPRIRSPGDFPYTRTGLLMLSSRAAEVLRDMLTDHGGFLPLRCPNGSVVAYQATTVLPALDEEKSELERAEATGRIIGVDRYVLIPGVVDRVPIFRIRGIERWHCMRHAVVVHISSGTGLRTRAGRSAGLVQ